VTQPKEWRAPVQEVQQHKQLSQRRVCQAFGFDRSSIRYSQAPGQHERDQALAQQLRALAHQHPRFGYRRVAVLLARAGHIANAKRVQRLWKLSGLSLPRRRPRKRHSQVTQRLVDQATRPNQVWCYDFVHDRCANGTALKMLTVENGFTRESLAIEVGGSLPTARVLRVLERLFEERGAPEGIRSDNGPEFVAQALKLWLTGKGVATHFIELGSLRPKGTRKTASPRASTASCEQSV
jgi:putative transposase